MTEIEFFEKVHQKYKESNLLMEGDNGFQIKRGMAHTVSGYLEDLFALFIATKINRKDILFYVDKVTSIRFNEGEKAKSFKPDLMIINENQLTHYFDLKSNLGWNRDAEAYLLKKDAMIRKLKGKRAWIRDKNDKSVQRIQISNDLKYHMVVVFGGNINPKTMKNNFRIAEELENVSIDVLHQRRKDEAHSAINFEAFENIYKSLSIYL